MLKRRSTELHINHERWLVSYADFVTLLFAFFVVMYSISQVNDSKYQELSRTLNALFSDYNTDTVGDSTNASDKESIGQSALRGLPELAEEFYQQLSPLIDDGSIEVSSNELWLQITLNNRILFDVGSVVPSDQAKKVFSQIAAIVRDTSNPIRVEGFTDNLAINSAQFPSNWQLSSARASAIVQLLVENKVVPEHLSAVGYGEFQPIADNTTEEGRAKNRRVTLMIGKYQQLRPEFSTQNAVDKPMPKDNNVVDDISSIQGLAPLPILDQSINQDAQPKQDAQSKQDAQPKGIVPITLKSGELLFTSDPDLPRNTR